MQFFSEVKKNLNHFYHFAFYHFTISFMEFVQGHPWPLHRGHEYESYQAGYGNLYGSDEKVINILTFQNFFHFFLDFLK